MLSRNRVLCLSCNKVLESVSRHDFVTCGCENETFVDGGRTYQRYGGVDLSKVEPLAGDWSEDEPCD